MHLNYGAIRLLEISGNAWDSFLKALQVSCQGNFMVKALLMLVLFASGVLGQDRQKLIGEIEFFGYAGIDLQILKAALPLKEGDEFRSGQTAELAKIMKRTTESIREAIGRPANDISPVCCDKQGNWMIYIGLSGKAAPYRSQPKGIVRLPAYAGNLYKALSSALENAIRSGAAEEDHGEGYALSVDPSLRKIQLAIREYALKNDASLYDVLENSSSDQDRIAAAEILGYARQSERQLATLVLAGRDSNSTVRNNATRALWVLVDSNPKLAMDIPPDFFVDMLLSGKWTDLNKSVLLLSSVTESGNEKALALLRENKVQERLIEMAHWRTGHAESARYLLGRIAGIDAERLKQLVREGKTEEIIDSIAP